MDEKTDERYPASMTIEDHPHQVIWTPREVFACAFCWSGFSYPPTPETPETYWLKITEKARNDYRHTANELRLLAVARGQKVAFSPYPLTGQFQELKAELGLKSDHRVRQVLDAMFKVLRPRV